MVESEIREAMAPTPEEVSAINPDPRGGAKRRQAILDELDGQIMDWAAGNDVSNKFKLAAMSFALRIVAPKIGKSRYDIAPMMEDSDAEYEFELALVAAISEYVAAVIDTAKSQKAGRSSR